MVTSKEIAVLVTCERVIRTWPVEARIAFRKAVFADVSAFVPGDFDRGLALVRAEIFGRRWARDLPWPPQPDELAAPIATAPPIDPIAIAALARRIRALGVPLALMVSGRA